MRALCGHQRAMDASSRLDAQGRKPPDTALEQGATTVLRSRRRLQGRDRPLLVLTLIVALSTVSPSIAMAHDPSVGGDGWGPYSFTCAHGESPSVGHCFKHHSYANARFFFEDSVWQNGFTSGITLGYSAWDRTNGHQFDFIRQLSDTSTNANVRVVPASTIICGDPAADGCTGYTFSGSHISEGSALIEFTDDVPASRLDDLAAHEFGHYLGLGHSVESYTTMNPGAPAGGVTLAYEDRVGRCMVYGHAHGWWGGCVHA